MKKGKIITQNDEIKKIIEQAETVAVLGLSPKPHRDSHMVAKYLQTQGYKIIPVRPGQKEILGEKAFKTLDDLNLVLNGQVDILDVFRNSNQVMDHVEQAIRLKPKVFWMQLGIQNQEAAQKLTEAGIDVIMNRCIKVDHERLVNTKIIL